MPCYSTAQRRRFLTATAHWQQLVLNNAPGQWHILAHATKCAAALNTFIKLHIFPWVPKIIFDACFEPSGMWRKFTFSLLDLLEQTLRPCSLYYYYYY